MMSEIRFWAFILIIVVLFLFMFYKAMTIPYSPSENNDLWWISIL